MSEDRPPAVDVGDPPGVLTLLAREMKPTPGRAGNTLRLTLFTLMTVAIGETFRLPDILIFAYAGFIVSGNDAGAMTLTSVAGIGAIVAATGAAILVFMVSLSQPALRLPLMAMLAFASGFVTKGTKLGHPLQLFGLWLVYNLPQGDQLIQGAAQQTYVSGNFTSDTLPNIRFMSPTESLVRTSLWTAFEMALAVTLLFLFNKIAGRDPARILRDELADRLEGAARVCKGCPHAAVQLAGLTRQGTAKMLKLLASAGNWHPGSPNRDNAKALIVEIDRLCLVLLAWRRLSKDGPADALERVARTCRAAEQALRAGIAVTAGAGAEPPPSPDGPVGRMPDVAVPLVSELSSVLTKILNILSGKAGEKTTTRSDESTPTGGLLMPDVWINPEYARYGIKLTIAAMFCYLMERLTNWSGIGTCLITVFVVSLDTTGQSVHKAMLRASGCLIGGALGISTILLLMPSMTTLADLLLVMTGPLLLASWIKSGSERSNYAGQQIAIAFYACILWGYGPTLDMEGARDRIVGILVDDFTVYMVFTTVWPVSVAVIVRKNLCQAFDLLGKLMDVHKHPDNQWRIAEGTKLREDFDKAIAATQAVLVNDPYEATRMRPDRRDPNRGRRLIDAGSIASLQAMVLPVSMILAHRPPEPVRAAIPQPARESSRAYQEAMSAWFHACARWMETGTGGGELLAALPPPPDFSHAIVGGEAATHLSARAAWFGVLHDDAVAMIGAVGADAARAARVPAPDEALASA